MLAHYQRCDIAILSKSGQLMQGIANSRKYSLRSYDIDLTQQVEECEYQ